MILPIPSTLMETISPLILILIHIMYPYCSTSSPDWPKVIGDIFKSKTSALIRSDTKNFKLPLARSRDMGDRREGNEGAGHYNRKISGQAGVNGASIPSYSNSQSSKKLNDLQDCSFLQQEQQVQFLTHLSTRQLSEDPCREHTGEEDG